MNLYFQTTWQELERSRKQVMDMLTGLTNEEFLFTPHAEAWSLGQVIMHIITVERLSLHYMKKKAQDLSRSRNSGFGAIVRLWIFIASQRLPFKFTAPRVVVRHTPSFQSVQETIGEWNNLRQDMHYFLSNLPAGYHKRLIYKHPQAGRFDARQALVVLREHLLHHLPQIKRLLKNLPSVNR